MTPSAGAETVVCRRSSLAFSTAASASRNCGLSLPCGPSSWRGPLDLGLRLAHAGFGDLDFLVGLVLPGFGVNSLFDQLKDSVRLFAHVVTLGFGLDQSLLCRGHRGGAGADGLANARQSGLGLLHGNFVGLRIDAE